MNAKYFSIFLESVVLVWDYYENLFLSFSSSFDLFKHICICEKNTIQNLVLFGIP